MQETFKPILDALMKEGFHHLPEQASDNNNPFDYRITPYSLNTSLSFKFDTLDHFVEFLKLSGKPISPEKVLLLHTALIELGLNPKEFFYVNFFKKEPEDEL